MQSNESAASMLFGQTIYIYCIACARRCQNVAITDRSYLEPWFSNFAKCMKNPPTRILFVVTAFLFSIFLCNSAFASSAAATVGQSVTFSVTASGTAPFTYQWSKNGVAITGATSASYVINSAATTDAASYAAVVTNSAGTTTSDDAVLTVNAAPVGPTITTQPSAQSVTAGQSASFTVSATGSCTLSYQWTKVCTAIS